MLYCPILCYALQLDGEGTMDLRIENSGAVLNRNDYAVVDKVYDVSTSSWMTAGWRNPSPWRDSVYTTLVQINFLCKGLQVIVFHRAVELRTRLRAARTPSPIL